MNSKSNPQLDNLIKRIYSSYIDIKAGDFKVIDKDILLADISQLYISVKEMYPSKTNEINALEQEIMLERSQSIDKIESVAVPIVDPKIETPLLTLPIVQPNIEHIEPQIIEPIKEEPKIISTEKELDLTMFMDNDDFVTLTSHPLAESKINPAKTVESLKDEEKKVVVVNQESNFDNFKSIPNITEAPPISLINKVKTEVKQDHVLDIENKSAGKIMDFLHDSEEKTHKDIYSFLDINTRIGLVELFFKGNSLELTESLVKINKLTTKSDCIAVVNKYAAQFGVKETEDIYQTFLMLIDRKFSSI